MHSQTELASYPGSSSAAEEELGHEAKLNCVNQLVKIEHKMYTTYTCMYLVYHTYSDIIIIIVVTMKQLASS